MSAPAPATAAPSRADRPLLGIALMLGFCVLAPLGDGVAKLIGTAVAMPVLLLARFAIQAAVLTPLTLASSAPWPDGRALGLIAIRTLLHIAGIAMMFTALRYLPLADAVAIAFIMPFIMLLLGHLVLGEEVGPVRLIACGVGFVGTLLVVQPNFAAVGAPALLPLGVAVVFAFFMLVARIVGRTVDPVRMQAISGLMALPLLLPLLLWVPADLILPSAQVGGLLLLLGLLGTVAHLAMTGSLRYAPSATLAPMQYLEIPFATLVGWAMFGDLPNGLAALGIAVTMVAGLWIIRRERASAARLRAAPPVP
ncbi:DMT family transporter [Wenxinia marina]|uniref:Wenxma_15, whole genome shotgun sequence n=1 Tax=Wenxinia marina DSM 24838 TaxID=1123501 RepID=A0A0D0QBA6_9RHOB|nr:DMT family transporter [Wenxinia marina]KIQ68183.1 putative permease [Wenxinia marina DSM 24838]GGL76583.1 membrane protein [Wenxinia marina]